MGQMLSGYRFLVAVGATASALTAASLSAEEQTTASLAASAQPKVYAAANAAAERIESALDQKLKAPISEVEAPLNQVLQILADDYEIPVIFDTAALDAVAASPETEVSIDIGNVSLRSALDLILKNAGEDLTYIIDNEVLLITTLEESEKRLEVRVYVVNDLVEGSATWGGGNAYDPLIDAIVATVEHESWMEHGTGEGEIQPLPPGLLVVAQTRRVHEQVANLLQSIRTARESIVSAGVTDTVGQAKAPITRSIAIDDQQIANCEKTRSTIRNVLLKSVAWNEEIEGVDGKELFLYVLPNRILVRHVPDVVRNLEGVVREIVPTGPRGARGGVSSVAGGGSGSGCGFDVPAAETRAAAKAAEVTSSPDLADTAAASEDDNQRQSAEGGGFF